MKRQDYEQLTLFQEDSPVSRFPWLETKKGKKTIVTYGRRCSELSESLIHVGLSVRTYLESCELPPGMWSRVWSVKDLTPSCLILKLRLSERSIEGNESRLWHTPRVPNGGDVNPEYMTETGRMPDGTKRQVGLSHQVKMVERGLWPTPAARDYKGSNSMEHLLRKSENRNHVDQLANAVKLFPTPTATLGNHGGPNQRDSSGRPGLQMAATLYPTPRAQSATGASHAPNRQGGADLQTVVSDSVGSGQLNPTWVEWLMGFPIGWTDLNASETR